MDTSNDLNEFVRITQRLDRLYPRLVPMAATEAVNFSKDRFRQQNWVGHRTLPWKKRKGKQKKARAILVQSGRLRRDVQKIYVGNTRAVIGTTRLTVPYARAHNEGYRGTVTVAQHRRRRFKKVKETYTTKKGNERTRTSKQVDDSKEVTIVRTHKRKLNIAARRFIGTSPVLDARIQRLITAQFIKAIKGT